MPTYEYQCKACGHQLEAFQKMSEASLTLCPACHQEELSRLVSAPGIQFKGSGWYLTDYSAKGKKPTNETTTKSDTKETKASDSGTSSSTSGKSNE